MILKSQQNRIALVTRPPAIHQVGIDGMDCDDLDRDALGINDDNLSDMVSANVSGRGTPNVSGRDTPSSQVTEGDGTPMEGGSRGSQPPAEGSQGGAEGGGGQGQHQQGPRRPSITAAAGSDSGRDQPRDEAGPAGGQRAELPSGNSVASLGSNTLQE